MNVFFCDFTFFLPPPPFPQKQPCLDPCPSAQKLLRRASPRSAPRQKKSHRKRLYCATQDRKPHTESRVGYKLDFIKKEANTINIKLFNNGEEVQRNDEFYNRLWKQIKTALQRVGIGTASNQRIGTVGEGHSRRNIYGDQIRDPRLQQIGTIVKDNVLPDMGANEIVQRSTEQTLILTFQLNTTGIAQPSFEELELPDIQGLQLTDRSENTILTRNLKNNLLKEWTTQPVENSEAILGTEIQVNRRWSDIFNHWMYDLKGGTQSFTNDAFQNDVHSAEPDPP